MKELKPAILLTIVFVALTGFVFPAVVWVGGQALFHDQANGSMAYDKNGKVVGSMIIAQAFADPKYFHPRPSAAGNGYDPTSSGGTNLGPISAKLITGAKDDPSTPNTDESFTGINDLAAAYRTKNGLSPEVRLPADSVTRSASGLDPEISPQNALFQAARVATARGLPVESIKKLIGDNTQGRFLGNVG